MNLSFLKATALTLLQALAVRSNEAAPASVAAVGDVATGAAHLTVQNNGLNGCLDDCDRNRGGQGSNGWEACRARCEADYGIGRRRSGRDSSDDWDSNRARDRRDDRIDDRIDRRSNNRRQRKSDRQDRIDKYGTLTTSFDGDRARNRRDDRINRRSGARDDRRDDRRRRNGRPPVAPAEDTQTDTVHVEAENNGLNGCLDDCDRNRGGQGNNGWEACRARCEADFGIGRRRSGRDSSDDWDSNRARDRRDDRIDDRIDRRSNNRRQRKSDRQDRIDEYGTLTTSFDGDRARDRRDDRINRRSDKRDDRRDDRRRRNGRPPVAPAEEEAPSDEVAPASEKDSQDLAVE